MTIRPLFAPLATLMIGLSACHGEGSGSSRVESPTAAAQYCHSSRGASSKVNTISVHRSADCRGYRGEYVAYFSRREDAESIMDQWLAAGRLSAAGLAAAEGHDDLAMAIRRGESPRFISSRSLGSDGRCEVVYVLRGVQYHFLLAQRGRKADKLFAWEPQ